MHLNDMGSAEFDQLDEMLDDVRTRFDETPQWEFCEGFIAALICCRRIIHASEYLPVLLDIHATNERGEFAFAEEAQFGKFMGLWVRRWNEIAEGLNTEVDDLGDERAYDPAVMDVRGAIAMLPPEEREKLPAETTSSYAQVWALGFMFAVESWPEEWVAPRDKDAAKWLDQSLRAIVALTDEDRDPPDTSPFVGGGPPSMSSKRLDQFTEAVWAVYDLRAIMGSLGPRVDPARKDDKPGRNDPCFCGSGKKYKKCHGAG